MGNISEYTKDNNDVPHATFVIDFYKENKNSIHGLALEFNL